MYVCVCVCVWVCVREFTEMDSFIITLSVNQGGIKYYF